jgi:hypothetical protein
MNGIIPFNLKIKLDFGQVLLTATLKNYNGDVIGPNKR